MPIGCAHCFSQLWTLAKLQFSIIKNAGLTVIKNPLKTDIYWIKV